MQNETAHAITVNRLGLAQRNRPIDFFRDYADELDLNPPYQRGDVWGATRQKNLWFSLLSGVPVPSIILNSRIDFDWPTQHGYGVIDGKQRITAILGFMHDRFRLPGSWFAATADVHYSELDRTVRRRLGNMPVATSEGQLPSLRAESQVFELVNFGGLAQGEVDADIP
ncbi:MAG: hypothetical protein ACJA07_001519 [Rhodococcus sp. (in: high G+C Gram-positive bacteria)]|jgi:hypothetical protein